MVRPLVGVDAALACDLSPGQFERMATMADPFRTPLPGAATAALLNAQLALPRAFPVRRGEAVGGGRWRRQSGRKIRAAHSVASEPRISELTGVTMGPPMMMAAS